MLPGTGSDMLDQVKAMVYSRNQHIMGRQGHVLIYIRMNTDCDPLVSKRRGFVVKNFCSGPGPVSCHRTGSPPQISSQAFVTLRHSDTDFTIFFHISRTL